MLLHRNNIFKIITNHIQKHLNIVNQPCIYMEKAVFGAGCFWHIQETFNKINGVMSTSVGYSGGNATDPNYEQVCAGKTGHTEVVEINFNPKIVSYRELLEIFWNCHDPTTLNRQGPDIGSQYRSVIYYFNEEQEKLAKDSQKILEKTGKLSDSIVTEIKHIKNYYIAEEYHQNYFDRKNFLTDLI